MHTKTSIRTLLETNFKACRRALIVLLERQTQDEQQQKQTKHDNQRGFTAADAKRGTELARIAMSPRLMTYNELQDTKRIVMKYAGQLAKIANSKLQQAA